MYKSIKQIVHKKIEQEAVLFWQPLLVKFKY